MSMDSGMAILFYVLVLVIPWILIRIAQASWKNWPKRGIILVLVMIYTLFAAAGIATPQPLLPTRILISVWLIFTFFFTLVSAYYAWPRIKE
jgi:hypothetical protein